MAVALKETTGDVIGAPSIAAFDTRMQTDGQPELAAMLQREGRRIEGRLRENMSRVKAG